jgi:hypothetical protein
VIPKKHNRHKQLPPVELLRELFRYDEETGRLIRNRPGRKVRVGQVVGVRSGSGYLFTKISRSGYAVHRLIYAMAYGEDPGYFEIDHIDGDKLNNRLENLRLATREQNLANAPGRKSSGCRFRGVSFFKPIRKWRADITVAGKQKNLGYFPTPEMAAKAYDVAARELFGEFAHPNFPQEHAA